MATTREPEPDKDSWDGSFSVPTNSKEWGELVRKGKLVRKTIHTLAKMASGSKVFKKQFVLLRTIWPFRQLPREFFNDMARYNLDTVWNEASQIVDGDHEFQKYFNLVGINQSELDNLTNQDPKWAGSLMPLLEWQLLCIAVPAAPPPTSSPGSTVRRNPRRAVASTFLPQGQQPPVSLGHAEDEAVVNSALMALLNAVSRLLLPETAKWTIARIHLEAVFDQKGYTALTDGALRSPALDQIEACVEVKKHAREADNQDAIQMQETAQLVGWMMKEPEFHTFKGHRLVVSQNADQLFLAFAAADDDYRTYLKDSSTSVPPKTFLSVQSYGPWMITNREHMENICKILVAITMLANQ